MKKIAYKSLQLFLLSAVAYLALVCVLNVTSIRGRSMASWATSYIQRIGEQEFYTFRDLDTSTTRYDFIALGSSHAMHGYDPRIFRKHGYELFNFGSSNKRYNIVDGKNNAEEKAQKKIRGKKRSEKKDGIFLFFSLMSEQWFQLHKFLSDNLWQLARICRNERN